MNATQNSSVTKSTFFDIGGGGVGIGDVERTINVTDPSLQIAEIKVEVPLYSA